jgi:uncharacterized protein DUF3857/transglutaminase superfamily protein
LKTLQSLDTYHSQMDSKPFETRDLTARARERVKIGPAATWIDPCYYDKHFTPKVRGQITHLLQEKQIHAELGQTYVHVAIRLESQQAVQHESQWRIGIEPQTQSIVLHSIKIRRGEIETEHASLERVQFLQREAGLERLIIQGSVTLLLLLEDVRPGDVLEYSFTVSDQPKLMPEYLSAFFLLPMGTEIGKYRFLIRHAEARTVKWNASSEKLVPNITTDNGEVCCYWMDANFVSPDPEGCAPIWQPMFPWIQVSDCPNWQIMARAVLEAWEKQLPGEGVAKMVEEIINFSPDPVVRAARAIELVQDGFRYLSVNVEVGGYIPAMPEVVLRRRYGDCKDLAFLLVHLLRGLGVSARPVLVDSFSRKSVGAMLPSLSVFNHVVVEFEIGTEKRWVDCTVKNQGGGALNRSITDFGVGLPIDTDTTELAPVPKASLVSGTFDVRESFVFDTTGNASYLALVISATGPAADCIRTDFANAGIEGIAKDRLQHCANRFNQASRIKPLEFRDDRDANVFVSAEAFEIQHTLLTHEASRTCLFQIRSDLTAGLMVNPGMAARRHPMALPYPCHRTHTVELEFAGLDSISVPLFQAGNQYFTFNRRSRSWPNLLKVIFNLETLSDFIPPDKVAEHRKLVASLHEASVVNLQLPLGFARGRKRGDFGALPIVNATRAAGNSAVVMAQKAMAASPPSNILIPVLDPAAVATEKTVEFAGLAPAKPMPPARGGNAIQPASESSRPSHLRRPRKLEMRCAIAFCLFLLSLTGLVAGFAAVNRDKLLGGLAVLIAISSWLCSLIVGVFGWKRVAQFPGRYTDNSKLFATITLALGGLLGLIFIPTLIKGFCAGIDRTRGRYYQENAADDALDFRDHNFMFRSPAAPWQRIFPGATSRNTLVAFDRPDRMRFTLYAEKVSLTVPDPNKQIAEFSKSVLRGSSTSYQLLAENEVVYNGVVGWQIETQTARGGYDYFSVQWLFATNGFGYDLTILGTPGAKSQVQDEAKRMFANFKLITPQN